MDITISFPYQLNPIFIMLGLSFLVIPYFVGVMFMISSTFSNPKLEEGNVKTLRLYLMLLLGLLSIMIAFIVHYS